METKIFFKDRYQEFWHSVTFQQNLFEISLFIVVLLKVGISWNSLRWVKREENDLCFFPPPYILLVNI